MSAGHSLTLKILFPPLAKFSMHLIGREVCYSRLVPINNSRDSQDLGPLIVAGFEFKSHRERAKQTRML